MAYIYNNKKGFKVIRTENRTEVLMLGGVGICDWCSNPSKTGYLVAVLNHWYCDECFHEWYQRAIFYDEDVSIETKKFNYFLSVYGLKEGDTGPMKEFKDSDGIMYNLEQLISLHEAHDTDEEFVLDDDDIRKIKSLDINERCYTQDGWVERVK